MTATTEICNGIDDDCDGEIDEGVSLNAAELADAGAEADGGCTVGVGACMRTGGAFCSSAGAPRCGAIMGDPGVETCNSIDDDCDGQVDEGAQVLCLVDSDDDHYANDATTMMTTCPDPTRTSYGNCPAGMISASASMGIDCAPTDATRYTNQQARQDSDNDTYCVQAATTVCGGASLPMGYRAPGSCQATDDCNDTDATRYGNLLARQDTDNDGYCVQAATPVCSGASPPPGFRTPGTCQATDDCNDTDGTTFQNAQVRTDADGDSYCIGTARTLCIGTNPPSPSRLASACVATDCDDTTAARFQTLSVRVDGDNDGYCSSAAAISQCTGMNPQSGYRLASGCNIENDCDEASSSRYRLVNLYPDADADQHCLPTATPTCVGAVATAPGYRDITLCIDTTDCNDTSGSIYRMVALRRDQDGDGYCGGTLVTNMCIGANPPSGYRLTCPATLDCNDNNVNATTSCTQTVWSDQQTKYCTTTNPATESLTFNFQCPAGFLPSGGSVNRVGSNCADGSCTQANGFVFSGLTSQAVSFTCEFAALGHDDWKLLVTCQAN